MAVDKVDLQQEYITEEDVKSVETALVKTEPEFVLRPVIDLDLARKQLAEFQTFVRGYLVDGEDFGTIPGTKKPTLYKSGADKLCEIYGIFDTYETLGKVEDFQTGLFDYTIRCQLYSKRNNQPVGEGLGSCNSYESKYRWREAQRICPHCQKPTIIKGKEEYGGGWLCFAKRGGCGAKFLDNAESITSQTVGKVQNEDIADTKNTVLKMAKKRAKIDAVLSVTRSSGIFTQDMEDLTPPNGDAPISNLSDLQERLEWIDNCRNEEELRKVYMDAYKAAKTKNDQTAMKALVDAKDKKRKEFVAA